MSEQYTKDQQIIESLQGTCNSIYGGHLTEEEQARFDDQEFCALLDSQIFQCTSCNWWCPIEEDASADHGLHELTCQDCCNEQEESTDAECLKCGETNHIDDMEFVMALGDYRCSNCEAEEEE